MNAWRQGEELMKWCKSPEGVTCHAPHWGPRKAVHYCARTQWVRCCRLTWASWRQVLCTATRGQHGLANRTLSPGEPTFSCPSRGPQLLQMQNGNNSCLPTAHGCSEAERRKRLGKLESERCGCGIAASGTWVLEGDPCQETEFLICPNPYLLGGSPGSSHAATPASLYLGTWAR